MRFSIRSAVICITLLSFLMAFGVHFPLTALLIGYLSISTGLVAFFTKPEPYIWWLVVLLASPFPFVVASLATLCFVALFGSGTPRETLNGLVINTLAIGWCFSVASAVVSSIVSVVASFGDDTKVLRTSLLAMSLNYAAVFIPLASVLAV